MAPARNPETLSQAQTWDRVKRVYVAVAGLCGRCAAQAAWGHQIGFSDINPPCNDCSPIVAGLALQKPNGWCALDNGRDGVAAIKIPDAPKEASHAVA